MSNLPKKNFWSNFVEPETFNDWTIMQVLLSTINWVYRGSKMQMMIILDIGLLSNQCCLGWVYTPRPDVTIK